MTITPIVNVTIAGTEFVAGNTYDVNYSTFTKLVEGGAMVKTEIATTTNAPETAQIHSTILENQPVIKSVGRKPRKIQ